MGHLILICSLLEVSIHQGGNINPRHHYCTLKVCGVPDKDTKSHIVEIAQFPKVSDGFQFVKNGPDFRNKKPIFELEIGIPVRSTFPTINTFLQARL